MPDYDSYQAEDFLMDDYFIEWIFRPSLQTISFWEDYKRKHPSQVEELEKAIQLCTALQLNSDYLSESEADILKAKIRFNVRENRSRGVRSRSLNPWMMAAAAVALVIVAGISIYQFAFNQSIVVKTAYGAYQETTLPDGSVVSLNGNSSLRYFRDFGKNEIREVWLDGEAFFVVTKSLNKKFTVHTDDLDVEVHGTSFNVDNRESLTRVVLNTGSITVHLSADSGEEKILLKPGEMIEYKKAEAAFEKQQVDPEAYVSWKEDTFDFDRVYVAEIAQMLEERYGYKITIADPELAKKFFTGRFSSHNIDIVIIAMERALGMEVAYEAEKKMVWKLH